MSLYYGLYVMLVPVFKLVEMVMRALKLDLVAKVLETRFGIFIIGLHDSRPKESAPKDSVSKTEIDHLSKMVNFWWDKNGPAKMLHTFYQVRVPLVVDGLAETGRIAKADTTKPDSLKGVRILEAGCGGGVLAEDLAQLGAYVVGVDPGKDMIDLANKHLETESVGLKNRIEYHAITVEEHAKKFAGTYDAVVCSEVMEHVDEKEMILEACVRCLKPGGSLFITTENQTMVAWFFYIILYEYILRIIPKKSHFYEKFVSADTVSAITSKYGCKMHRVRGFFYDRPVNSWYFIDNQDCNYGLHVVKR
ncbi:ubiquinone biosynthesis O-methyltransferase, mitochondrial-like [Topomyia yanbarensis]|uniref:ubiquinone biosynthesis O-methyltransferase, mitochondrial-like n=1 Tax=Topomyia yanbarensis TaxID=2498891 RepID=UPI00273AA9A9|nr:ubiquinone biosynthesis O-methyltransferase, mitochondrial-like [Topomyia yanbarensis]